MGYCTICFAHVSGRRPDSELRQHIVEDDEVLVPVVMALDVSAAVAGNDLPVLT